MINNVFTHPRFQQQGRSFEVAEAISKASAVAVHDYPLKGLPLPKVVYGESVVGEVTPEEAEIFRSLWDLKSEVEAIDRHIQAETMRNIANAVEAHDDQASTLVVPPEEITECLGPDERSQYWTKRQRAGYLHALFHYTVGQRLGLHHVVLGLREGGVIVKLSER